jgi:hypothetical protein
VLYLNRTLASLLLLVGGSAVPLLCR